MVYITDIELPCEHYTHPLQMYPDIGQKDLQPAKYREVFGERSNPDICALPPPLSGAALMADNMHGMPCYNAEMARSLPKSERLAALASFKDIVTVYMPWHAAMERRFYECLLSAYRRRTFGLLDSGSMDVLSISRPISTSVQDISLIGTAGSGKSTAVRLMLDRIPRGIQHDLDGKRYVQIPVLETTAREGDMKSIFIDLAMTVDKILGESCYELQMRKMKTVTNMEAYLVALIQSFHVGIIVIDEIQNVTKRKQSMFDHVLSVTASAGVAVMIIGTESAITDLNQNEWFSRRFSHLGRIASDFNAEDTRVMEQIIQIIWGMQWTRKQYPLTKSIMTTLLEVSCQNVDLLTTIYITAQLLCIHSEGKNQELVLDERTIRKAADQYPMAKQLLRDGMEKMESMYQAEKRATLAAITREAQTEREKEQRRLMQDAVTVFSNKEKLTSEIAELVIHAGFSDTRAINSIIRSKSADPGFLSLTRDQQAKAVIVELLKREAKKGKEVTRKTKRKEPSKKTDPCKDPGTPFQDETIEHGLGMLQASVL